MYTLDDGRLLGRTDAANCKSVAPRISYSSCETINELNWAIGTRGLGPRLPLQLHPARQDCRELLEAHRREELRHLDGKGTTQR